MILIAAMANGNEADGEPYVVPTAVFAAYRDTFHALQDEFPDVAFIAATVPLTTERGPLGRVKASPGRGDKLGPEHNVVREQFSSMVHAEYASTGRLFDIASVQSTSSDGTRVAGRHDGNFHYAMDKAYASDPGHPNPDGARVAASAMAAVLAGTVR